MVIGGSGGAIPTEQFSVPRDRNEKKSMLAQMFEQQMKAQANSL
jgi:hypothetical protein